MQHRSLHLKKDRGETEKNRSKSSRMKKLWSAFHAKSKYTNRTLQLAEEMAETGFQEAHLKSHGQQGKSKQG